MKRGLDRGLRGGAASLRMLWTSRGGVCLAGVAIAASVVWFVPVHGMHLVPDRGQAAPITATAAAKPAPTQPASTALGRDSAESKAAAPATEQPHPVEAAYLNTPASSEAATDEDRLVAPPLAPSMPPQPAAPPQAAAPREALAMPEPEPAAAVPEPARAPLIPPAVVTPSRPNMVPDPRPPLPLETDLIPAGTPDPNTAAQSAPPPPAATTPTGKPTAPDRHG